MSTRPLKFDVESRAAKLLCEEFGDRNVETALVYITEQCDPKGLRVCIEPTYEMVRDILEAAHGRLGLDDNRILGNDKVFYHHPDASPIG